MRTPRCPPGWNHLEKDKNRRENPPKIPRNPDFLLLFRGFSSGFRCVSSHGFFLVSCASGGGWGGATKGGFGVGGASVCLSGRLGGGWGGFVALCVSRSPGDEGFVAVGFVLLTPPPPPFPPPPHFFFPTSFFSIRASGFNTNQ